MTQIRTSPHRAERSTKAERAARIRTRTVAKYVILTVCGVVLYREAAVCALAERGYRALGGEASFLLLPVIYYAVSTTVRDFIDDLKNGYAPNYEEDNK